MPSACLGFMYNMVELTDFYCGKLELLWEEACSLIFATSFVLFGHQNSTWIVLMELAAFMAYFFILLGVLICARIGGITRSWYGTQSKFHCTRVVITASVF